MESLIHTKSLEFSYMIVDLYQHIIKQNEYVLSKQILRSWTSIWANVKESKFASSKKDFVHKMRIALKEANETSYRIDLIEYWWYTAWFENINHIKDSSVEIIKILSSIVKTTKENIRNNS